MQHGYARSLRESPVEHPVQVAAVRRDVPVQVTVPISRKDDLADDASVAVEAVPPAPKRQADLFLAEPLLESAEKVTRKFLVKRFSDDDPVDQRTLQILRMCRSR